MQCPNCQIMMIQDYIGPFCAKCGYEPTPTHNPPVKMMPVVQGNTHTPKFPQTEYKSPYEGGMGLCDVLLRCGVMFGFKEPPIGAA